MAVGVTRRSSADEDGRGLPHLLDEHGVDPANDLFVVEMVQDAKQRGAHRAALRELVYTALPWPILMAVKPERRTPRPGPWSNPFPPTTAFTP